MMKTTEEFVRRNPIVYRCATPDPAQSLFFGNGRVGGSVHTPDDSLYLLVSRSDIWNEKAGMGAIAAVRVRGGTGLFVQATSVRQMCDLYDAAIQITVETPSGTVNFSLTCPRNVDVLVLDIEDNRAAPQPFTVAIENWHEGDVTTATETVHVNRASSFAEYNHRAKIDAQELGIADPLLGRTWGLFLSASNLSPDLDHRIVIAAVCHPPRQGSDGAATVRAEGRSLLARAKTEAERWLDEHHRHWREFWHRSWIALESATGDAEYEERLWYTNLYLIACACGGAYPPRFNGATYLLDKDARSWDYGYWFQNMREVYWPLLATGHWEFMRGFFQMYFDALPFVCAQTKNIFGIDAPSFRETQSFWGWSPDTDLVNSRTNQAVHHNFSSNLEVCLLMEWYTRASGDEPFLRGQFYPFLKEILRFFVAYAKKGDDGRYHIAPSNALEVWPDAKDPMPDIAGLRYLLPRLIAWGEAFGEDPAMMARWREFLQNLAPIPIGRWTITSKFAEHIHAEEWHVASEPDPNGLFLPAADKTCEKMQRRNMENAELYVVFPWGLVGMDSPEAERRRFENTWNHRTWKLVNNGWAQDVPQLARMGWAEAAKAASLEHASYSQRFPSGAFISPARAHFHGLLTDTPYLDSAGAHLMGLNEMLFQSYDGIIRICPAVSAEWSGQFKLHALDGFVVEASFTRGRPVRARITATRDALLRVRGPEGLIENEARKGESMELVWPPAPMEKAPDATPRPEIVYPGCKIRPAQACHPTGHWHDERNGHGQVGLAEDGLFPATRSPQ